MQLKDLPVCRSAEHELLTKSLRLSLEVSLRFLQQHNARAYALKKGGVGREAKVHKMLGGGVDQWICRALVPLGIAIGGIGAKETITAYFGPF